MKRVISLGAGVQSTAMLLMSQNGILDPVELAIFADTGWEPKMVYTHLEKLLSISKIPIEIISTTKIRDDYLNFSKRSASIPHFVKNPDGKQSLLWRQCTSEYKIMPIRKRLKELGFNAKNPVELWMGISTDEIQRIHGSKVKLAEHRFPLIEKGISRRDCEDYLRTLGIEAPKSSCIGCPYHNNAYWRMLKKHSPEEFSDAVNFDEAIRHNPKLRGEGYLHRSLIPLKDVDFGEDETEKQKEWNLIFSQEGCDSGMCNT